MSMAESHSEVEIKQSQESDERERNGKASSYEMERGGKEQVWLEKRKGHRFRRMN